MTIEEADFSGQAIMRQLEERRAAQKKNLNRNVSGWLEMANFKS